MRLAATKTANQDQVHFEAQAWLMGFDYEDVGT